MPVINQHEDEYTTTVRIDSISFVAYAGELCWLDVTSDEAPDLTAVVLFDRAEITLDGLAIDPGHEEAKYDLLHWYLAQKEYGQAQVELTYQGYGIKVARFFRGVPTPDMKQQDHGRRAFRGVPGI